MNIFKKLTMLMMSTLTGWMIITSCVIFYMEITLGDSFINSLLFNPDVWYAFITPSFMHVSFIHLLLNMFTLFCLGVYLERYMGKIQYVCFFIFAAVVSNSAQGFIVNYSFAGMSGVIFAVAAYLMIDYHFKRYYKIKHDNPWQWHMTIQVLFMLGLGFAINAFIDTGAGLANMAHLYGFLSGGLWAMIRLTQQYPRSELKQMK